MRSPDNIKKLLIYTEIMVEGNTILLRTSYFEFRARHFLVIAILTVTFTCAFILRAYPAKYGFYLNEFDPYFNYRATKYIIDHGLSAYWNWHDTMSWYPDGRDIAKTSQSGLHVVTAFLYTTFGRSSSLSLLDFTIIFPVIIGSLTTIAVFALVRTIASSTTAGMFAALLFAISPPLILRGNLGWFKSEPLGLFFGILVLYLILSAIKSAKEKDDNQHRDDKEEKDKKYCVIKIIIILKSVLGGVLLGLANASWGGAQYFVIPISLIFIALPFFKKTTTTRTGAKSFLYIATIFTAFVILTALAFPRPAVPFVFGFSTTGIPLVGPGITLVFATIFLACAHFFLGRISNSHFLRRKKISSKLLLFFFLIAFFGVISSIILGGTLRHITAFRYVSILSPFALPTNALIESVAEHARPTFADYLIDFSILLLFAGVGAWIILKRRDDMSIFALIIGITAIYVSTGFVRLLVYASLGVIVLAAIGLYEIIRIIFETRDTPPAIFTARSIITDKRRAYDHISDNSSDKRESTKRKRERIGTGRRVTVITSIALIMVLLILPLKYPPKLNWLSLADIPPTILNGGTGYTFKTNEWLDALNWLSTHTPKNAVIAAWWDYGYWITVLGNRTSLADNATINQTRIATIAKMFMEKPENGVKIATSNLKADYILIYVVAKKIPIEIGDDSSESGAISSHYYYTLGGGGDESKIADIIEIGGVFKEHKYLEQDEFTPTPRFWNMTLLGTLMPFSLEGYTLLPKVEEGGNLTTIPFKQYKTGSLALYSYDIKYNKEDGLTTTTQPLSLAFSSGNLLANGNNDIKDKVVSAVLVYKVNRNYH